MTITQVVQRWDELRKLINDGDSIPILLALRKKRMRFSQIQKQFELSSARLEKVLKFLRNDHWVIPHIFSVKGKKVCAVFIVEYRLSKRGEKLLELLD